jgi:glycosyltransferase involved in cell wall biosynthesis
MALRISVVVCAFNEERYLPACLHSLLAQTRPPDELLVVNNASTDQTAAVAAAIPGVRVVDELRKGLVLAREAGRAATTGDILAYVDADCRAPLMWLSRVERRFERSPDLVGVTAPYRFYDWDWLGRALLRGYDFTVGPLTQVLVKHVLRLGSLLYGGNFAVRRAALDRVGFDTSIEFHGEDTDLGRRLSAVGPVRVCPELFVYTSARRYQAMGKGKVFSLYVRNFVSEMLHHRPADEEHLDVRM